MTIGMLLRHTSVLIGISALLLANAPVKPAIAADRPAAAPGRPNESCMRSTHSIRQLAMIDHTSDGGFQCLGVFVDGETVKAIRLERHSFASGAGRPASEHIKIVEFPPTIVESPQGAVIDGIPGHDAIVLHGRLPSPPGNGTLEISYLYNGFTGEYHSCQIALDRMPNSGWRLVNRFDQTVSLIMVRLRHLPVIGVVGIDTLEGACT